MMRKEKRKRLTVSLAAAVLLTCFLAQTIDGYRLTKTERRDGRRDVNAPREGQIVFGKDFDQGPSLEPRVQKASPNASVADDTAYQADFPGWPKGQMVDSNEAKWKRLTPSLQCGLDQMRFRAIGPGASQLALAQGNAPPLPLSQIPAGCGYNMQRNSMALVMAVPYDGCNVVQEGGSYMLPLRWHGIPVLLLCSKPPTATPTTVPPVYNGPLIPKYPLPHHHYHILPVPQTPPINREPDIPNKHPQVSDSKVPHSFYFPPHQHYPHYHQYPSIAVAEPTISIKKPEVAKIPQYPHFHSPHYPFFPHPLPVTTAAPASTTAAPAKQIIFDPSQVFPFHVHPHFQQIPHLHWPFPGHIPGVIQAPVITEPAGKPHILPVPPYVPFPPPYQPFFPPHHHHQLQYPPDPKPEMTTASPTTTKKVDSALPPPHPYYRPHLHSHSHPHGHPFHRPHNHPHSHLHSHPLPHSHTED